jgi:hypothetical protein
MRNTDDANWPEAYEDDVIARSLRLTLAGDETVLFLDPLRGCGQTVRMPDVILIAPGSTSASTRVTCPA